MSDFWSFCSQACAVGVFKFAYLRNGHLFAILAMISMEMIEKNINFSRELLVNSNAYTIYLGMHKTRFIDF